MRWTSVRNVLCFVATALRCICGPDTAPSATSQLRVEMPAGLVELAHGPIEIAFQQAEYEFDPDALDAFVSIRVTNNTTAVIEVTHVGQLSTMVVCLPSPIALKGGGTMVFTFLTKPQSLSACTVLNAAVGFKFGPQTIIMTATAQGRLKGLPIVNTQRLTWRVGEKAFEQRVGVTFPGGEKIARVQIDGADGAFSIRLDSVHDEFFVLPNDTSVAHSASLQLITEPPLNPRLQVPLIVKVEPGVN